MVKIEVARSSMEGEAFSLLTYAALGLLRRFFCVSYHSSRGRGSNWTRGVRDRDRQHVHDRS